MIKLLHEEVLAIPQFDIRIVNSYIELACYKEKCILEAILRMHFNLLPLIILFLYCIKIRLLAN